MTQLARGPNGNVNIALYATESAAEAAQARVFVNGQHDEADKVTHRKKIEAGAMSIVDVKRDAKGITIRWAIPRQIPEGPHAGKWFIPVPADEGRTNARDPQTGEVTTTPASEWSGIEIDEFSPAWFLSLVRWDNTDSMVWDGDNAVGW